MRGSTFKRIILSGLLLLTFVVVGCSEEEEQTVEEFFDQEMERMRDKEEISYELVYSEHAVIHEDDAIGFFVEQYEHGEQFFNVYFEKQDSEWQWRHTRFLDMNTYTKWSDMDQTAFFYAGILNNDDVSEVIVGDNEAKIITTEENNRIWYIVSQNRFAELFYEKEDGTRERVEPIDFH